MHTHFIGVRYLTRKLLTLEMNNLKNLPQIIEIILIYWDEVIITVFELHKHQNSKYQLQGQVVINTQHTIRCM